MAKLSVSVHSDSYLLSRNLRIDVRNDNLTLIDRIAGGGELDVPAGLYEVSAVLEDGREHRQLVQVVEGKLTRVTLSAKGSESDRTPRADGQGPWVTPSAEQPMSADGEVRLHMRRFGWNNIFPRLNRPRFGDGVPELVSGEEAEVEPLAPLTWRFRPKDGLPDRLPWAVFATASRRFALSLPVNPLGGFPVNSCTIEFEQRLSQWVPKVRIAKERIVASTLQNMLEMGQILRAAEVAREATDLLQDKYADPVGAALGATVLNKVGLLRERVGWLRNLARDFPWLGDGAVLLASILATDPDQEREALEWLLRGAEGKILFTENYSGLVNLLRRWPGKKGADVRAEALARLADSLADIDWSMATVALVSERTEREEDPSTRRVRDSGWSNQASG